MSKMLPHSRSQYLLCLIFLSPQLSSARNLSIKQIDSLYQTVFEIGYAIDSLDIIASRLYSSSRNISYEYGLQKAKVVRGYYFISRQKPDSALKILGEIESFAQTDKKFQNSLDHGRTLLYSGRAHFSLRNYDESKEQLNKALTIFNSIPDAYYQGTTLHDLGILQYVKSNYTEALEYFISGYQLKKDNGFAPSKYLNELKNIADIYNRMGHYDKAIEYLEIVRTLSKEEKKFELLTRTLMLFGNTYSNKEVYDSALMYYSKALKLADEHRMTGDAIAAQSNIANTYSKMGKYELSNLQLFTLKKNNPDISENMMDIIQQVLAGNHYEMNNYDSCVLYATSAFHQALKKEQKQSIVNLGKLLAKSYEKLLMYDSSLHYSNYWHAYKDSIFNQQNQNKLNDLLVQMEVRERESKIQLLEKQQSLDNFKFRSALAGIAALLIIGVSVFINLRNKRRAGEQKLQLEKEILTRELEKNKNLLSTQVFQMIHKSNGFEEIESHLSEVEGSAKNRIRNVININKALEKDWVNFNMYFSQVHNNYYDELKRIHPDMTISEQRLAALVKMRLTNKEISSLLNIEARSVKMARYRLKKKLKLSEDQSLGDFLENLV
ncbi:MAG: tetratricopeptide repeat protein [Cyclobacteriaceae bacterium]